MFIYGADSYRSRQKLNKLKEKFQKDIDTMENSVVFLDGEKLTLEKLNEAGAASSLFAAKRMIVIERLFSNKSTAILGAICDYLKKSAEKSDNIFIVWDDITGEKMGRSKLFKYLNNLEYVEKFVSLTNTELVKWIENETQKMNVKISRQAASTISGYFENNMWNVKNEVDKLIHYKLASKEDNVDVEISVSDVEGLCRGKTDENIFALTDAISNKNKRQALELLDKEIENGVTDVYLLHMISRQFKILIQLKDAMEDGMNINEIKNQFKMHPFVIQKASTQARNFSIEALRGINDALLRIEKAIKTGKADARLAMSVLISRV